MDEFETNNNFGSELLDYQISNNQIKALYKIGSCNFSLFGTPKLFFSNPSLNCNFHSSKIDINVFLPGSEEDLKITFKPFIDTSTTMVEFCPITSSFKFTCKFPKIPLTFGYNNENQSRTFRVDKEFLIKSLRLNSTLNLCRDQDKYHLDFYSIFSNLSNNTKVGLQFSNSFNHHKFLMFWKYSYRILENSNFPSLSQIHVLLKCGFGQEFPFAISIQNVFTEFGKVIISANASSSSLSSKCAAEINSRFGKIIFQAHGMTYRALSYESSFWEGIKGTFSLHHKKTSGFGFQWNLTFDSNQIFDFLRSKFKKGK